MHILYVCSLGFSLWHQKKTKLWDWILYSVELMMFSSFLLESHCNHYITRELLSFNLSNSLQGTHSCPYQYHTGMMRKWKCSCFISNVFVYIFPCQITSKIRWWNKYKGRVQKIGSACILKISPLFHWQHLMMVTCSKKTLKVGRNADTSHYWCQSTRKRHWELLNLWISLVKRSLIRCYQNVVDSKLNLPSVFVLFVLK